MRKIIHNGRVLELVLAKRHNCSRCAIQPVMGKLLCPSEKCYIGEVGGMVRYGHWRETMLSRVRRFFHTHEAAWGTLFVMLVVFYLIGLSALLWEYPRIMFISLSVAFVLAIILKIGGKGGQ